MAIQARTRVPSAAANGKNGHTLISDAKFRQLYALALQLQMLGERPNGDARRSMWLRGREAALAGVTADLRADDVLVAEYGADVAAILRGRLASASSQPTDTLSLQERMIEVVSRAAADVIRKNGRTTAIFLRGEVAAPVFEEVCKTASRAKLPVLFVEDRTALDGSPDAANEMPSIPVDAQDVVALYRVAHESITRARRGGGPTHILCMHWELPVNGHTAASEDAVEHLEHWLIARGLPAQEWRREIVTEFASESTAVPAAMRRNGRTTQRLQQETSSNPQSFA